MRTSLQSVLDHTKVMVIDGSMSTALEQMGCDLNDSLWTAKALVERPELVRAVHMNYFRAGADCGISCSYQTSIPGLMAKGYTLEEAEALIARAAQILLEARNDWWAEEGQVQRRQWPLCLGSIGPYGAYLADGSEYRGNYGVTDEVLRDFHTPRMKILWDAGVDLLLLETQPSLHETLLEAEIAESLGADYWVSFSCKDGRHINEGDFIRDCVAALSENHPHLKMIGVNCTAPEFVEQLIRELKSSTDLPVAVYPNSGEQYDPNTKTWYGNRDGITFGEYARRWIRAGASAVGGCCRTVETHVQEVVRAREITAKIHI